ncbi:Protein of unknown function [Gryllus bimaculatus]|nr:Protein of unknown function [Gryllus bimaculatus]
MGVFLCTVAGGSRRPFVSTSNSRPSCPGWPVAQGIDPRVAHGRTALWLTLLANSVACDLTLSPKPRLAAEMGLRGLPQLNVQLGMNISLLRCYSFLCYCCAQLLCHLVGARTHG